MAFAITPGYLVVTVLMLVFAAHEAHLLLAFSRFARERRAARKAGHEGASRSDVPFVTVQLPLYNEPETAGRAIEAACALDYPKDRFEVIVLDDSSDTTSSIVDEAVSRQAESPRCTILRRTDRAGFKAGALARAFASTRGELVALFDADFVPPPSFLRRLVLDRRPFDAEDVAFVQARWSYFNRQESLFTRIQAMLLDRHFFVEKPARSWLARVTSFNGSAGIWRRSAIDRAGGWTTDTLTEDLDLSYRVHLEGFRGLYVQEVSADSELPSDALTFKLQQRRWARGSMQCLRKLARPILASARPRQHKLEELITLAGYAVHPIMLANLAFWPWAVLHVEPRWIFWAGQIALTIASIVGPLGFVVAAREREERLSIGLVADIALAVAIGLGLMVSNTAAMVTGLFVGKTGTFERTPKKGTPRMRLGPSPSLHWTFFAELLVIAYCALAATILVRAGQTAFAPACVLWGLCLTIMVGYQVVALARR